MAKPFSVHSKAASSSTSSAKTYLADCSAPSASSRPRRHRQPRQQPGPSPSSGVLTVLAAICASTVAVHGRPIDAQHTTLPFLYPFTHDPATNDDDASAASERLVDPLPRTDAAPTPAPTAKLENRSSVADKYIQGTDGLWRKMNEWSLYGSTVCSGPCPTAVEGAATVSSDDHSSDLPDSSSINDVNLDSLPSGWKPSDSSERDLTTVIIALSLVLAVLIIACMVGSVFWRRKRRKYLERDVEKKTPRREGRSDCGSDDEDAKSVRQAKATQRKWARATSRWRDNIRYSARRRRTMRTSRSNASQEVIEPAESESTFVDPSASSPLHSRPPSRTPSRQSVAASDPSSPSEVPSPAGSSTNLPTISPSASNSASATDIPRPVSPLPISDPSYHPPAYRPSTPPPSHTQATARPVYASPSYQGPADPIPSSSKLASIPPPPLDDGPAEDDSHHPPSQHAGHVATDDKEMLARMAAMSSAPPVEDSAGYFSHPLASVPPLDDISEMPFEACSPSPSPYPDDAQPPYSPPRSGLPPPPDKGKMAARYDDYPYSLEQDMDIEDVEPEPGPSAPPFEDAGPSAPPFEEAGPSAPPFESSMEPSAPPLHDGELEPSAPPPWEDGGVGAGAQDARGATELEPAGPPGPTCIGTAEHGPDIACAASDRPP